MPPRPQKPGSGGDPPDDGGSPPRRHDAGGGRKARSVSEGERWVAAASSRGRSTGNGGAGPFPAGSALASPSRSDDNIQLSRWENNYDNLSSEPLKFNVVANDGSHTAQNAHTARDHGPQVPLRAIPDVKTIEGRIYGEKWPHAANASTRWSDWSTMNRTINEYVRSNWEQIRSDLAIEGKHETVFDAGHRIGEGFVNRNMGGAGPRQAQYVTTSVVRLVLKIVPGSDPPDVYIKTSFPAALG